MHGDAGKRLIFSAKASNSATFTSIPWISSYLQDVNVAFLKRGEKEG